MTLREEITTLRERIVRARAACDGWHASGLREKYLEAYSMVEALELQLERLRARALPALLRALPGKTAGSDA